MIDLFDYTDINTNHQAFFTNGITNSWQVWTKPKGVSYVYITCIGSGGGGGSSANVGGSTSGGGGGGGASSVTKILLPANVIPDSLYIQVARGGIGGDSSNENAVDGSLSYVSISPLTTASRVIIASGTVAAGRGLRGTSLVGGSGGSAGTVFTSAVGILSELGIWQSIAGRIGATGGYGAPGGNVTGVGGGTFLTGGAGGGGLTSGGGDDQGGSILATGAVLSFNITGGAAGGGQGRGGYASSRPKDLTYASRKFPQILTGGSGGGSNGTVGGGGGNGGPGQIGCGGGGAGAQDGGAGRIGGRGGDGIVLITTF